MLCLWAVFISIRLQFTVRLSRTVTVIYRSPFYCIQCDQFTYFPSALCTSLIQHLDSTVSHPYCLYVSYRQHGVADVNSTLWLHWYMITWSTVSHLQQYHLDWWKVHTCSFNFSNMPALFIRLAISHQRCL